MDQRLGIPCFDIFMRALRFTYRNVDAAMGSFVTVKAVGEAGGTWYVERQAEGWRQVAQSQRTSTATVTKGQDTAWRILTKRRNLDDVLRQFPGMTIEGDKELGCHALTMVSVMT